MLLAYEAGATLIVAVGTHATMVEFLDKGRRGMASTFLTRLRLGPVLVDAKGVSRLYEGRIRRRDMLLLVASALAAMVGDGFASQSLRVFLDGFRLVVRGPLALDHGCDGEARLARLDPRIMVNFRFHLVSLIAVFLALGLGILDGVDRREPGAIVDRLDREIDQVRKESTACATRIGQTNNDLDRSNGVVEDSAAFAVDGRLTGVPGRGPCRTRRRRATR